MRRVSFHALLALMIANLFAGSHAMAGDKAFCRQYFADQGPLREEPNQIGVNEQIPEDWYPIETFVIHSLIKQDGTKLVPATLPQSNCHLERVLTKEFLRAFDLGAREAGRAVGKEVVDADLDRLYKSIDARLDKLYVKHGMPPRNGALLFRIFIDHEYRFERYSDNPPSPIQRSLREQGICLENVQLSYVVLSLVASRGVTSYAPERFADYFRSEGGCSRGDK